MIGLIDILGAALFAAGLARAIAAAASAGTLWPACALLIAGGFTFLPMRLLGRWLLG